MSSIRDKINTITSLFTRSKSRYSCRGKSSNVVQLTGEALTTFVEKYKGVRRTLLAIVVWINIHIFFVTIEMYRAYQEVDIQWVIFAGYWTAILATFIGFYTMSRTREFNSETGYSRPGEWMHKEIERPTSSYSVSEYTEDDDPSFYNNSVPIEIEELDGDSLMEDPQNG